MDLYYDREARFSDLQKNIEVHPDPLLDSFVAIEKIEAWIDEARKEFLPFQQRLVATKGNKLDWKETCKRMELTNIEREKWLLKWFGKNEV